MKKPTVKKSEGEANAQKLDPKSLRVIVPGLGTKFMAFGAEKPKPKSEKWADHVKARILEDADNYGLLTTAAIKFGCSIPEAFEKFMQSDEALEGLNEWLCEWINSWEVAELNRQATATAA
jgi:hypothetical protein